MSLLLRAVTGSCTEKRKVVFFMNINEQTVSRNLNSPSFLKPIKFCLPSKVIQNEEKIGITIETMIGEWKARQIIVQCGVRIFVLSVTLRNAIYSGTRA